MKKLFTFLVTTVVMSALFLLGGLSDANAATLNVPGDYGTIQAAINAASPGDEIVIANGSYNENLVINKSLTLHGESRPGVIITPATPGYGITVTADDVSLRRFTLKGTTGVSSGYGIKVAKCNGCGYLTNLLINNVKVEDSARSHIDLNGVADSVINNVVVANTPNGVGIGLQNNVNVTLTNITSTNNAWGGVGIWSTTKAGYPTAAGSNGVVVENLAYSGVPYGLYTQETDPVLVAPTADEFICTVTSSNTSIRANIEDFVYYFKTKPEADAFATLVSGTTVCADSIKPTAAFIIPDANEIFTTNSVDVSLKAGDNIELASVVINIKNASGGHLGTCYNNGNVGTPDHTANCTINTTSYVDGTYELRAGILDHAGNRLTISRNFIIDRAKPNVTITTPANGAAVKGSFVVSGTADDATSGIKEVLYTVNQIDAIGGSFVANVTNGVANGTNVWDYSVSGLTDGFYRLRVQAFDNGGNWRYRYHDVQVDVTKPVTTVVSPADGSLFDADFTININSTDTGSEIAKVVANLYGTSGLIGPCINQTIDPTMASVDFTCDVDVDTLVDGAYYIKTNAVDAAGNLSNTVTWNFSVSRAVVPVCGNGIEEDGEQCDLGELNTDMIMVGYGQTIEYCSTSCLEQEAVGPYCGDGEINDDDGEQCDDGNTEGGDGCSASCHGEGGGGGEECTPSEEICNEIDDDCDGEVDEGLKCDVTPEEPEECTEELETTENTTVQAIQSTPLVTATTVVVGDSLHITAEGAWAAGNDDPCTRTSDANGINADHACFGTYGMNGDFPYGALVGRINGGNWFFVGTNYNGVAASAGTLELMYWDSGHEDNSGSIEVTITKTTTVVVECPEECEGDECDEVCEGEDQDCNGNNDDEDDTPPPSGGAASSISSISAGPSTLLETGPEDDDEGSIPVPATAETVIEACEEDTYILERLGKLSNQSMEIIEVIPSRYARTLGTKALKLSTHLTQMLRKTSDAEARNDIIRRFVCRIEQLKEARGLRHAHIGADSGGDEIDYLLQYLQDLAIMQFVK